MKLYCITYREGMYEGTNTYLERTASDALAKLKKEEPNAIIRYIFSEEV